jgi:hypothetical protein
MDSLATVAHVVDSIYHSCAIFRPGHDQNACAVKRLSQACLIGMVCFAGHYLLLKKIGMTTTVIKPTHPDRASGEIPGSTGGKFIFEMIEAAITSEFVAKHKLTRDEARLDCGRAAATAHGHKASAAWHGHPPEPLFRLCG